MLEENFYKSNEVMSLLKISRSTLYFDIESGRLPGIKKGNHYRFPKDQIDLMVRKKEEREKVVSDWYSGVPTWVNEKIGVANAIRSGIPGGIEVIIGSEKVIFEEAEDIDALIAELEKGKGSIIRHKELFG